MVDYSFTTDQGWRVTEYRPFSASYAIMRTPCILRYGETVPAAAHAGSPPDQMEAETSGAPIDLVARLTGQQLRFDHFSLDVLRQLLQERVTIRDRNRSAILGRLADVSGELYGASLMHSPDAYKRRQGLERSKMDLERELRETDERLWKDTAEIRERVVTAARKFDGTHLRTGIFAGPSLHNDERKGQGDSGVSG
jgi:hypothetical protein